jgi:hypothetical protein
MGFNCKIWLLNQKDFQVLFTIASTGKKVSDLDFHLPKRQNEIEEYFSYKYSIFEDCQGLKNSVFVVPEAYAWSLPLFSGSKVVFWWLSFDNSLYSLSQINLNQLRRPHVFHVSQSKYAADVVYAITKKQVSSLSDYTSVPPIYQGVNCDLSARQRKVVLNASHKIIFDLEAIVSKINMLSRGTIECQLLRDLSRRQVYESMTTARLFVDLASFPGKDRMPREAVLCGSLILLADAGAATSKLSTRDFDLSKDFYWDMEEIDELCEKILWMVNSPDYYFRLLEPYKRSLHYERQRFDAEVCSVFGALLKSGEQ